MSELLSKLKSRKLWVTLLTLAAVVLGANQADGVDPDKVTTIVASGLGALYVIIEGLVDHAKAKAAASANTLSPEMLAAMERFVTLSMKVHEEARQKQQQKASPAAAASVLAVLLACLGLGACTHAERPPCSELTLAQIEAAYVSEVLNACKGKTYDACQNVGAIETAYQAKLEEWAQCQ